MTTWKRLCLLLGLLLMSGLLAPGLAMAQARVYERMSDEEAMAILKHESIECEVAKEGAIKLVLGGFKCVLANKKTNMYLYAYFKGAPGAQRLNEWNKAHRFSHAHVDDDGDAILESDLDLEGGVTGARFVSFVRTYQQSIAAFAEFLKQ